LPGRFLPLKMSYLHAKVAPYWWFGRSDTTGYFVMFSPLKVPELLRYSVSFTSSFSS
jgi:hypothetical protein